MEKKVKVKLEMLGKVDSENYMFGNAPHQKLRRVFIHLQQCYNVNEDCKKVVVERIVAKQQKTSDQETDKDDGTEHEGMRV
jgi:hypothetical protein